MENQGIASSPGSSLSELDLLVEEARDGSNPAFEKLWRHYQPKLLRYLSMFTRDAEDLCSEVWIRIAGAIKGFVGDSGAFQRWIFTIARNAATDHARKEKRIGPKAELNDDDWVKSDSSLFELTDLLKGLPADQCEVITLRIIIGMEIEKVAQVTGKSASYVRVLSHRGLAQLNKELVQSGYKRGGAK